MVLRFDGKMKLAVGDLVIFVTNCILTYLCNIRLVLKVEIVDVNGSFRENTCILPNPFNCLWVSSKEKYPFFVKKKQITNCIVLELVQKLGLIHELSHFQKFAVTVQLN